MMKNYLFRIPTARLALILLSIVLLLCVISADIVIVLTLVVLLFCFTWKDHHFVFGIEKTPQQTKDKQGIPLYDVHEFTPRTSKYCVCVFVINEGEKFNSQLAKMKNCGCDIIVADGGSTDGSTGLAALERLGVNTLLVKTGDGKLGTQMRMAFDFAIRRGYEGVIIIDGNGKDSVENIPEFSAELDRGFGFVQGSRFIMGGHHENTPKSRLLGLKLLHAPLISLAAGHRYTDTTNGFRAYSTEFLNDRRIALFRPEFTGYELHYYLAIQAARLGYKVKEIPVSRIYPSHGKIPTKISPIRGNIEVLGKLFKVVFGKYDTNPDTHKFVFSKKKIILIIHILSAMIAGACFLMLLGPVQSALVAFGENVIVHHPLNASAWYSRIQNWAVMGILAVCFLEYFLLKKHFQITEQVYYHRIFFFVSIIALYLTFNHNFFRTADEAGYMSITGFQRDSEAAVVHPIVSGDITGNGWFIMNGKNIWSEELPDHMLTPENYMTPLNLNDGNWENGVSIRNPHTIVLNNNSINRELNKPGAIAILKDGLPRKVVSVLELSDHLYVLFDKPISASVGYPYMYKTDIKLPLGIYRSQAGIMTYLFTSLTKLHPPVWIYHAITALLLAVVLSGIAFCVSKEFGIQYGMVFLFGCIVSRWLVVMGRNLYWQTWLMFLPMLLMWLWLVSHKNIYAYLCAIALLLKFLTGYEYITSICIGMCTPIVYFAVRDEWPFHRIAKIISLWAALAATAFLLSVFITANTDGRSINALIQRAAVRTIGNYSDISTWLTIKPYIQDKPINNLPIRIWMILVLTFFAARKVFSQNDRRFKALGMATLFSILSPLSWYIIGRQHSYIHTHINHVLWTVPFIPMAFVLLLAVYKTNNLSGDKNA